MTGERVVLKEGFKGFRGHGFRCFFTGVGALLFSKEKTPISPPYPAEKLISHPLRQAQSPQRFSFLFKTLFVL